MHKAFYKQSITQDYRLLSNYRVCLLYLIIVLSGTANIVCILL